MARTDPAEPNSRTRLDGEINAAAAESAPLDARFFANLAAAAAEDERDEP